MAGIASLTPAEGVAKQHLFWEIVCLLNFETGEICKAASNHTDEQCRSPDEDHNGKGKYEDETATEMQPSFCEHVTFPIMRFLVSSPVIKKPRK